jgi:hypothetical protein
MIMKRSLFFLWVTAFLAFQSFNFSIYAAEEPSSSTSPPSRKFLTWGQPSNVVDIGLGYLFYKSNSSWTISFPDQYGRGRSVLDFNDVSGGMPILNLDINHPNSFVSLSLQYGSGQNLAGDGKDSDYLNNGLYYQSRFDVSGGRAFWIADIQTTFSFSPPCRWVIKPFIGWEHFEEKLKMTDGFWTIYEGWGDSTPIFGLNSSYDFNWNALRMGVKGEMDFGTPRQSGINPFRLKTHLALFPYIQYEGRGVWNLRDDFRQDPSFVHKADNFGLLGLDGLVSFVYRPLKALEFEAGGRISYFYVQDGTDTTYFSDNSVVEVTLDEAKTFQAGLFFKITGRF